MTTISTRSFRVPVACCDRVCPVFPEWVNPVSRNKTRYCSARSSRRACLK
jgi:hypothetical protein